MELGAFSISLAVKDLKASKSFYEKLGFSTMGGDESQNWLIMKNESKVIGLFQGMFPNNIMTFNPGWDQSAQNLDSFKDIREISKDLKEKGIQMDSEEMDSEEGPANFMITDPDGNTILFDQHR